MKANFRNLCHLRSALSPKIFPGRKREEPVIVLAEQLRISVLCCDTWANIYSYENYGPIVPFGSRAVGYHRTVGMSYKATIRSRRRLSCLVLLSGTNGENAPEKRTFHAEWRTGGLAWRACLEVPHPCL